MSMFEKATRLKVRFNTPKGLLTVEDLWDLPLTDGPDKYPSCTCLDNIAKGLRRKLRDVEDESFVKKTVKDDGTQLQFDIVKHVIEVRLAESDKAKKARENREKRQKILAAIADKEDQGLKDASIDDLKKLLEEAE